MGLYSKMTDILGNNMSITRISCLLMHDSVSEKYYTNTVNYTHLNQDANE